MMLCTSKTSRFTLTSAVILAIVLAGSAVTQAQTSTSAKASSDELRVAVVMSNSALAVCNPDGQISGLAADLGMALVAKDQVNLKLVPYENIVRFNQIYSFRSDVCTFCPTYSPHLVT